MQNDSKNTINVMIVVGEASGDGHAAHLIDEIRAQNHDKLIRFFGCVGQRMIDSGAEPIVRSDDLAIMGLPEVIKALPMFLGVFKKLRSAALERKPGFVVLVDFPEFNLKLAKRLKKDGFKIVYFISPQVWAWRQYRAKGIGKYVDLLLSILPFEKDWYASRGVKNVEFVGNPIVANVKPTKSKEKFCSEFDLDVSKPIVALLPGSRRKELTKILPIMLDTVMKIHESRPFVQFAVGLAHTRKRDEAEKLVNALEQRMIRIKDKITLVEDDTYNLLNAADCAAVASGTATLETAVIGTPMVVVYKTSELNWRIFRPLIRTEFFSLPNLIAKRGIVSELIHTNFNIAELSEEITELLKPDINKEVREELAEVRQSLIGENATQNAARLITERFLN